MNLREKIAQTLAVESGIAWEDMPDVTETESMPGKDWCYRSADAILAAVADALTSDEAGERVARQAYRDDGGKLFDLTTDRRREQFRQRGRVYIAAALRVAGIVEGEE